MNDTPRADVPTAAAARAPGWVRRWWRDASLRRKLLAVTLLAMLACVPPMGLALVMERNVAQSRSKTESLERLTNRLDTLQDTLAEADNAVRYYAILGFDDPRHAEDYRQAAAQVPGLLTSLREDAPADLARPVDRMAAAVEREVAELDRLAAFSPDIPPQRDPSDRAVATQREPILLENLLTATDAIGEAHQRTEAVESALNRQLSAERDAHHRLEVLLSWSIVVGWLVALAALVVGTSVVAGSIVRRVERLSENGQRFLLGRPLLPVSPSRDEIGQLTDGVTIVGEMLDQRRREAVAANRAKDRFLSRISHELRTPLTAVIGFGQLLEDSEDLSADDRDAAHRVVRGGEHMLALINDLLDTAKMDTGHLAVDLGATDVAPVADEAIALVSSLAEARAITIDLSCPEDVQVLADPQRLRQVLLNLLSNAVKYNRHAGHVDVDVVPHGEAVRISVSDTGRGIGPEDRERLFQPFERLDAAHSGIEGSGIGLALSKRLVEAMGGTVGVDSEVGRGTTFWIELGQPSATPAVPASTSARD